MRGHIYESHSIHPQPERSPILPYFVEVYRNLRTTYQQGVNPYTGCCTASKFILDVAIHHN